MMEALYIFLFVFVVRPINLKYCNRTYNYSRDKLKFYKHVKNLNSGLYLRNFITRHWGLEDLNLMVNNLLNTYT